MPGADTTRVKTTGRGELDYSDQLETTTPLDEEDNPVAADLPVLSVVGENIGDGEGIYAGTNGSDKTVLEFKTLKPGNGIVLTHTNQTIIITATGNSSSNGGTIIGDGFDVVLGDVEDKGDGSWANGAVTLTDDMPVSEAVDRINELLGLLIPSAPTTFPNGNLVIQGTSGSTPLLAVGVTNNSTAGTPPAAGSAVVRITGATFNTNVFNDVGPSDEGVITAYVNDVGAGSRTLTSGVDDGTYGALVISDEKDFPPSQPGFWKSMDVGISTASAAIGINKAKITHTAAGSTADVFFVRDDLASAPVITAGTVTEQTSGTVAMSSGIPHYNTGAILLVAASYTNIAGQTYYGGADPLAIVGTNGVIATQSFGYSSLGITTPISRNTLSAVTTTPVAVTVDGVTHGSGLVQGVAKNVVGSTAATNLATKIVLVKRGTASASKIDELLVPVTGLGSIPNANFATRTLILNNGNTPIGAMTTWDPAATLQVYEAAVFGGQLANCQIDFSNGYLPAGPNYSVGRNIPQYATFVFARSSVSTFKINITGTYGGVWIKLPGVSDNSAISPNASNGWWDATKAYNGAGVPGNASDASAGCAQTPMAGSSGAYTITFGPQSSTNATSNNIIVRIRLNAGQAVTALSFSN